MTGFFAELSKQLAERWLKILILPGMLFVAVVAIGSTLGHRHALDLQQLLREIDRLTEKLNRSSDVLVSAVGILLTSAATGLLANALAVVVTRLWIGMWPSLLHRVATQLTARRRKHWEDLSREIDRSESPEPLMEKRARYAYATPQRPTWMGDRLCGVDAVVFQEYRLDLGAAWPRFWLLISAETRTELTSARSAYERAAVLGGWGLLYVVTGLLWWPATLVGAAVFWTAWTQARNRVDLYAGLAEAMVDLNITNLAEAIPEAVKKGNFHHHLGDPLTRIMRKGG